MNLDAARRLALALPEVTEEPHFASTSFRIKGKIIATAPPEGSYLHVFVPDERRDPALAMYPGFIENLYWGGKIRGLRVLLAKARAPVVAELLQQAWLRKAPKALAARLKEGSG